MNKIFIILFCILAINIYPCDLPGHYDFEVKDGDTVLYSGCYDAINHGPHIVTWVLTKDELVNGNYRRANNFNQQRDGGQLLRDINNDNYLMPTDNDYSGSGYDRGHMAPAEDFDFSQLAKDSTFFMGNIWPQNSNLNQNGAWIELEKYEREVAEIYEYVKITIIVNTFTDEWITTRPNRHIRVPAEFIKILEYSDGCEIYVIPNIENTGRDPQTYCIK